MEYHRKWYERMFNAYTFAANQARDSLMIATLFFLLAAHAAVPSHSGSKASGTALHPHRLPHFEPLCG